MKNSESYIYYKKTFIIFLSIWLLLTLFTALSVVFDTNNLMLFIIVSIAIFVFILPFMLVMLVGMIKSKKAENLPFEMGIIKDLYPVFHFLPKQVLYAEVELDEKKEILETHPLFPTKDLEKLKGKEIQVVRKGKKSAYVLMVIR